MKIRPPPVSSAPPCTPFGCALLALAALAPGCPAPSAEPDPEPTPPPGFDPTAYEQLSYDLTEPDSEMPVGDGTENVFAAARFRIDTPARILAVEAMWKVRRESTAEAHLAIWPDFGHNFFDFDRPNPLREWNLTLDRFVSDEQWTLLPLDEPIVLNHPQLLYVGTHYRGELEQPLLMVDDVVSPDPFLVANAPPEAQYPPHVVIYPDRGRDSGGFETVLFAGASGLTGVGDLMVRLVIERFDVVTQTWFSEQHALEGEPRSGLPSAGSVAWGDCNDDGWLDVYNGALFINGGDGTFTAAAPESGLDGAGGAGMWGDYNNDGVLDLFVARNDDQLFEGQGECAFVNVTAASGIDDTQLFNTGAGAIPQNVPTPAAAWADVNGDGLLDLYQANFLDFGTGDSAVDKLWINQGDGLFVDATTTMGLNEAGGRAGRGVHPADWDNDGDMDLYVSNYRLHQNFAWSNEGAGGFDGIHDGSLLGGVRHGTPPNSTYGHTIGSAWGDLDNDGDLDLLACNLAHPRFIVFSDRSMLLRNELVESGALDWTEMRDEAGLLYMETDSSPVMLDYDNDGDLDLFYTAVYDARPSYLYRNDGDWVFTMVSYPAGTWIWNGWGVAAADYDQDGDMDLYGKTLLRNDSASTGASISIEAIGSGTGATNRSGIGARIRITTAAGTQLREVTTGVGVGNQMPLRQTVGLGDATEASVVVEFPITGTTVEVGTVAAGSALRVHEDGEVESR